MLTKFSYSTCLGRVSRWKNRNKLGFTDLDLPEGLLELLREDINGRFSISSWVDTYLVAPNGLAFAKPTIRRALLAKMLSEILDTRIMIKNSMSNGCADTSFAKLQNNRQLALKFIANVTYGYTSASFSGRMPCAEIADSIVQTGRETLEKVGRLVGRLTKGDRGHPLECRMGSRSRLRRYRQSLCVPPGKNERGGIRYWR